MADQLMKPTSAACPDAETIAAYLDGRLSGAERTVMAEHFTECEDCYSVFSESARVRFDESSDRQRIVPVWRKFVLPAVGLAAAAILVLIVQTGRTSLWRPSHRADVAELVAAVGTQRSIEPRLTGGFAYGPLKSVVRSGMSGRDADSPDLRIATANIEKLVMRRRTPQTLAVLGVAYLAVGDGERAVPVLEQATTSTASPDPHALSDLAAAYLVRSEQTRDTGPDLGNAIWAAKQAITLDPSITEAWFNLALAIERRSPTDARPAWEDYLRFDSDSQWAAEARIHLQRLGNPSRP